MKGIIAPIDTDDARMSMAERAGDRGIHSSALSLCALGACEPAQPLENAARHLHPMTSDSSADCKSDESRHIYRVESL